MKINRGVIALLLAILIWGSTLVISKIALEGMGAMTLTFGRFLIAYLLLFPLAARRGYRLKQSFQKSFLLLGLTGVALHYALQNIALLYTSAMSAALISAGGTFIITLTAILFLKEKPTLAQLVGIAVSVAGVTLISLAEDPNPNSTNPLLGNLLFLLGTVAWSAYTVLGKRLTHKIPPLVLTTASFGSGLIFLLPFTLAELFRQGWPAFSGPSLAAGVYLGVVATALPMFAWNYSLQYIPASTAAAFLNLVPIVGVVSSLIVGETIGPLQIAGGALAIVGVWFTNPE